MSMCPRLFYLSRWYHHCMHDELVLSHVVCVQAWTSTFPRNQILFLRNEDYQAAPKEHLQAVMKFLGMHLCVCIACVYVCA